jgi:CheY-like chemotaxis protein
VNILVLSESPVILELTRLALEPAGHQVTGAGDAHSLAPGVEGAGALLVDVARARQGVALLRDRSFAGRALVLAEPADDDAEVQRTVEDAGADGALAPSPMETLAARFARAVGGRRRVLVVDDSEIAARLLREELESAGFEVQAARDAEMATSLILKRATRPDLILLDVNMPGVTGAQFCRFVKTNDRFKGIKVVLCSGEDREKVAALAAECGADGFLTKDQVLGKWIAENV